MLVTTAGLVLVATAQDRMLRAYARDDGDLIWAKELPGRSEGIMAMYEVSGQHYVAVPAGARRFVPVVDPAAAEAERILVFALPWR